MCQFVFKTLTDLLLKPNYSKKQGFSSSFILTLTDFTQKSKYRPHK